MEIRRHPISDYVILEKGDPADRTRGYWSIDRVGHAIHTVNFGGDALLYTEVDYFMRCPFCETLFTIYVEPLIAVDGNTRRDRCSDCIQCSRCDRHYWVDLAGMPTEIRGILKSRGDL